MFMNRALRGAASALAASFFLVLAAPGLAQAEASAPTRKSGTIYKKQVDGLIRLLRGQAKGGALGGESVVATAQILTAMGYSHRRYHRAMSPCFAD